MRVLYEIDKTDKLLAGIQRLRKEDLAIIQENGIGAHSEHKFVHSEKFSLIFQDPICRFIENNNYLDVIATLESQFPNAQEVVSYFCHEFVGARDNLRNFDKYVVRHFSNLEEKRYENPLIAYPF